MTNAYGDEWLSLRILGSKMYVTCSKKCMNWTVKNHKMGTAINIWDKFKQFWFFWQGSRKEFTIAVKEFDQEMHFKDI